MLSDAVSVVECSKPEAPLLRISLSTRLDAEKNLNPSVKENESEG